jgi:hypothetical protein
MALFIYGMPCRLCMKPMNADHIVVSFSPFIGNEADPLVMFNDGTFHEACFNQHPLAARARARYADLEAHRPPGPQVCIVCETPIRTHNEFFTWSYLTDIPTHPLQRWNYATFHSACLPQWPYLNDVYTYLYEEHHTGRWTGRWIIYLLSYLRTALESKDCGTAE